MQVAALFSTLCAACPDQSYHIPENHLLCRLGAHTGQRDQHYSWKFINFQQAETTWEAWLFFTVKGRQPIHGVLFVFPDDISVINCSRTWHFTHFITLTSLYNTSWTFKWCSLGSETVENELQIYAKGSGNVAKTKDCLDHDNLRYWVLHKTRCMKICKTIGYVMFF